MARAHRRSRDIHRHHGHRPAQERSGAEVPLLAIIALVSLVVALGLYALRRVEMLRPLIEERQQRLEQAADPRKVEAAHQELQGHTEG